MFKRGHRGMGYYRDGFKLEINLALSLPAALDAAPVTLKLDDLVTTGGTKHMAHDQEPDTCPRRKRTNTGRKSKGKGLELEWPSA